MNKTLIALLGLIIVFADGASIGQESSSIQGIILSYINLSVDIIIQSLSAVSVESSTDDVTFSEWTETTSSTSYSTMNWETSSISGTSTDVIINPSTVTDVPNICQQSNSSTDYIFPNPEDCTTFYLIST
jgi:hypothetical protein